MHLKRIKIVTFVSLYCFFLLLLFSEGFISDFQEMRRSMLVNSSLDKTETLHISKRIWNTFSDTNEINFKGHYYDVKSFSYANETVKVVAYKDSFELLLKAITKNLNAKNKKTHSIISKKPFVFYFVNNSPLVFFNTYNSNDNKLYHYNLDLKNNYSFSLFRPPTLV